MFRAQQNVFDEAVAKATDENLTSENWQYILDVCDKASAEDSGPKDVVGAMIKRLAHRNANVQLYTLVLANSLSQNCGVKVHRELASRSFTDALLRLANDRNTHQQVKAKILERMAEWAEMFSKDPDLGVMEQAFSKLKSQNPNLQPPSKPTKAQITDLDRQKEDEELQMALELSVKDRQPSAPSGPKRTQSGQVGTSDSQAAAPAQPISSSGTTAATVSRVRALFDFMPSEPGELQFKKGDIIAVLESVYKDWWKGSLRGQTGIFPLNYVEKLSDPTEEDLQREAQMEAEVFAEIKNVEKLLTLLSTSNADTNVRDNEEITTLYHSTLAIRPKLIELIGKYSQRKDDFTQLNEKFIKARRDYEAVLEASMSPQTHPGYGRPGYPSYGYSGGYPTQGQPPQNDPARYYTPNPQDSRTPQPNQVPPSGQQPPYMANHGQPVQHPQNPQRSSSVTSQPPQQYGQNAPDYQAGPQQAEPYVPGPQQSFEYPQELSTSTYSSPADRPQHYQQPYQNHKQNQPEYPPPSGTGYPPQEPNESGYQQQQQQQQYPGQQRPPPSGQQPLPGQANLYEGPPQAAPYGQPQQNPYPPQPAHPPPQMPSPDPQNPYPVLNSEGPPPPQQQQQQDLGRPPAQGYQAYQPNRQGHSGGSSDPNDYYR